MALIYNGISFCYPLTEVHVMGPEFDTSHSDQLFTTIRLRVRSLLYVNSLTGIGILPAVTGTDANAGQLLARIRHLLTTPRCPLYYDFLSLPGTTTGLPPSAIINLPDGRDDANGPFPDADAFSATYTTPDCIEVTWACTVKLRDCGFGISNGPISLRWDDSISWDKYFSATYQRTGTMIISSRSNMKVDEIRRSRIAPRVAPGFHRHRSNYTISRDGLRCDFHFVDKQIRFAPPPPAVEMDITQSESFPLLGGMRMGEVAVSMKGIQNANVRDLAMWAITVAKSRVWAANPLISSKGTVVNGASPPILRTRETTEGVDVVCVIPYKAPPKPQQEQQSSAGGSFWGGLLGAGLGFAVGGFAGAAIGAGVGARAGGQAFATPEGKDPTSMPVMPWIGYGTSPQSPQNPPGFAVWAHATAAVNGPADGVSTAPAVALYAALLEDPCGASLSTTPLSGNGPVTIRTNVNLYNTPAGGAGGEPAEYTAQLAASVSALTAAQYPTVLTSTGNTSLYDFDDKAGVYDYWQCLNEYIDDAGTIVLPTCNPNGNNIKVVHSSEMVTLRKRWAASRTGAEPKIPPRDLGDPNWVYIGGMQSPREMKVAPDGVSIQYEVSGVYEYQALNPDLVKRLACVPPFLLETELRGPRGWVDNANSSALSSSSGSSLSGSILGGLRLLFPPPN